MSDTERKPYIVQPDRSVRANRKSHHEGETVLLTVEDGERLTKQGTVAPAKGKALAKDAGPGKDTDPTKPTDPAK